MVSGYGSALYEEHLAGWRRVELQVMNHAGVRTECVWMNFPADRLHWARYAGRNFTDRQRILSAALAKCAAEANKPDAAVVWRRGDLPAVYADLKLEDLPGAGPRICVRLRAAGLTTVEAIHDASRSRIVAAWGSIEGERVRLDLQGEDVPARVSRRRSVAHGRVLTGRDRCWREARRIVRWLGVCALHRCACYVRCEVVVDRPV